MRFVIALLFVFQMVAMAYADKPKSPQPVPQQPIVPPIPPPSLETPSDPEIIHPNSNFPPTDPMIKKPPDFLDEMVINPQSDHPKIR
jgi:hypothetical protein